MSTDQRVLSIIGEYDPHGKDANRALVQKGVDLFIQGKKEDAESAFKQSGLNKSGILYFAIREYYGNDQMEEALYLFILDGFDA